MVKAKVVAVLEIRFLDNNSQITHNNNSHTEVVEEASLKAGGPKRTWQLEQTTIWIRF